MGFDLREPGAAVPAGVGLVRVWHRGPFVLPDGIAAARLEGAEPGQLIGNAGSNRLEGGPGDDVLDGRGGDDVLRLGGGRDAVLFGPGSGNDVVEDFRPGEDSVWITEGLRDWAAARAALRDTSGGAVLTLGGATLRFAGLRAAELTPAAFEFPVDPTGWATTFEDGFDRLSRFDARGAGTWRTRLYHGDGRRNTPEDRQTYVDPSWRGLGLDPFAVRGGVLRIESRRRPEVARFAERRDLVSGVLTTEPSFAQAYGYFEARMRMPRGRGLFPAFWLLPTDHAWPPEIDVVEVLGRAPGEAFQMGLYAFLDTADGFHTYGLEWSPERVAWYVDGRMTAVQRPPFRAHLLREAPRPMYLLLNLGVGGAWAGDPVLDAAGRSSAEGVLEVDWVRVRAHPQQPPPRPQARPPSVSFSGAPRPGAVPGPGRFAYVPGVSGRLNFSLEDLGIAGPEYLRLETRSDRAADRYEAALRFGCCDVRRVEIADADGGTFALSDLATVALRLGGRSEVTIQRAQSGTVETGPGNDAVRVPEMRRWLTGEPARLQVSTGAGDDLVEGWAAPAGVALEVEGGPGNDRLTGSADDDVLAGGPGDDVLRGGAGVDSFVFRAGEAGNDTVEDFEPGRDRLRFEGLGAAAVRAEPVPGGTRLRLPGGASVLVRGLNPARWLEAADFVLGTRGR